MRPLEARAASAPPDYEKVEKGFEMENSSEIRALKRVFLLNETYKISTNDSIIDVLPVSVNASPC